MEINIRKKVFNYNLKEKISKISLTDNSLFNWIYKLMYLQLLFVIFSLRGAIILGIFPSFLALSSSIRKILQGKNIKFFSYFRAEYNNSFAIANKIGYLFSSVIAIAFINLINIDYFGGFVLIFSNFLYIAILYLSLSLIFSFSILAHYEFSFFEYITHAIIFPLGNVIAAIFGIVTILFLYTVFNLFPVLFFVIGISSFALCMHLIFEFQIKKLERGHKNGNI